LSKIRPGLAEIKFSFALIVSGQEVCTFGPRREQKKFAKKRQTILLNFKVFSKLF